MQTSSCCVSVEVDAALVRNKTNRSELSFSL
jgi:hypothetical protein